MSNLYIGTQKPKSIYVGTSKVLGVYLSTEKVWASIQKLDAPTITSFSNGIITFNEVTHASSYGLYDGNTLIDNYNPAIDYLCFTAQQANSSVTLNKVGTPWENTIKYSTDRVTWTDVTFGTAITLANIGDKVYYKGNGNLSKGFEDYYRFSMTGLIAGSGSLSTLLDETGETTTMTKTKTMLGLFYSCISLTTSPSLPTNTTSYCYYDMFRECSNLTIAPSLPATEVEAYSYQNMFRGCTKLAVAPELSATSLGTQCYGSMFSGCTSLVVAPVMSSTSTALSYCFLMFSGCTSLTTVPSLYTTELINRCYDSMFSGCTSLIVSDTQTSSATHAWRIPASGSFTNTTAYAQDDMFSNCLGTRSSDTMSGALGESHTYYTQNAPV